jgi:hypothetical protein
MNTGLSGWIQNAPADDFWFYAIVALVAAAAGFFGAFYFFYRKRLIEDTPTSKIRSAAQGYIELSGRGELLEGQPITAPLTKTICTWYSYQVEEHRGSGKNARWVTVDKGDSDELFLLIDDTGQCVIDPEGANVTPSIKESWYGSTRSPTSSPLARKRSWFSFGAGRYRYTEKRMHPGEILYAIGLYKTVGGASSQFNINDDVRDILREWKSDSESLMAKFDKNKDGQIDMEEWQKVREEAYKAVVERHAEVKNTPPVNVMSNTRDRRRPYLLSAVSQSDMIRRFYYYSISLIILFFICGAIATWLIGVRLATG